MKYRYPKKYYKEKNHRYYLRHKEKILARIKKYRKENPEKIKEQYEKAKERHKIDGRRYYLKRKQYILKHTLEWQKNNPEKVKLIMKKARDKYRHTPLGVYRDISQSSRRKKRGRIMTKRKFITWYDCQEKKCIYCGVQEDVCRIITGKRLTIERLDNSKGYVEGNIALACDNCNKVKSNILTEIEMKIVGKIVMKKKWKKY